MPPDTQYRGYQPSTASDYATRHSVASSRSLSVRIRLGVNDDRRAVIVKQRVVGIVRKRHRVGEYMSAHTTVSARVDVRHVPTVRTAGMQETMSLATRRVVPTGSAEVR